MVDFLGCRGFLFLFGSLDVGKIGFVFLWGFGSLVKLSYSEICIEHGN